MSKQSSSSRRKPKPLGIPSARKKESSQHQSLSQSNILPSQPRSLSISTTRSKPPIPRGRRSTRRVSIGLGPIPESESSNRSINPIDPLLTRKRYSSKPRARMRPNSSHTRSPFHSQRRFNNNPHNQVNPFSYRQLFGRTLSRMFRRR
jgi:hypothetical protein